MSVDLMAPADGANQNNVMLPQAKESWGSWAGSRTVNLISLGVGAYTAGVLMPAYAPVMLLNAGLAQGSLFGFAGGVTAFHGAAALLPTASPFIATGVAAGTNAFLNGVGALAHKVGTTIANKIAQPKALTAAKAEEVKVDAVEENVPTLEAQDPQETV